MLVELLIVCLLIWFPVLLYQISHRGFLVLLMWILIAPVASNLVNRPDTNPLFQSEEEYTDRETRKVFHARAYLTDEDDPIKLKQLLEPTRTFLAVFLGVFFLETLLKKRRLGPFDKTEIWMCIFSLILLASVLLQSNRLDYSMRIASDGFMVGFLAYFVGRRLVTSEDHLRGIIQVMGYMGLSLVVFSLMERMMHVDVLYRLGGPFRNPGTLYFVIAVAFFTTLSDSLRSGVLPGKKEGLPQGVRWFVLSLAPVIILLTWSRGNWVGFLMGVWVYLLLGQRLIKRSLKLATIGMALILVAVIGIGAQGITRKEGIGQRVLEMHTGYGRIATWKVAVKEGIKHPIFGIGLNNMRDVLARDRTRVGGVRTFPSVHNSFLKIFAEQGTLGLLAYLAIVTSIIRMGLSLYRTGEHPRERWRGVAVIAIMVAYLIPALFASTLHIDNPLNSFFVYIFIGGISGLYSAPRSVTDTLAHPEHRPSVGRKLPIYVRQ